MRVTWAIPLMGSVVAGALSAGGPLALRVDGLGPVKITVTVPLPGPARLDAKSVTGLSEKERERLRARIELVAREELERGGFRLVEPATEDVPLFVVYAESHFDGREVVVSTAASISDPAVSVLDASREGYLTVWRKERKRRVASRKAGAEIESSVRELVREFTGAQAPVTEARE